MNAPFYSLFPRACYTFSSVHIRYVSHDELYPLTCFHYGLLYSAALCVSIKD